MVQCFKRYTCRHGAITDNGNALPTGILLTGGHGHAQSRAYGGAGMAHTKGIVLTLSPLREAGQAVLAPDSAHLFTAACEDLVWVGLVAHIPYQAVFRCIENIVQRHREFEYAKPRTKMATGLPD